MEEKLYKARVEISLIVEIDDIQAVHEDNAAAVGDVEAGDCAVHLANYVEREGFYVANWGVRCIEAEEQKEE